MAFSRFYNAPQYQYVSQFVPRNLAVMDQALARSQKIQDEEVDKMSKTYDAYLKQGALTGPDTEARDKLVEEVKSFSASMANQDLTQAANRRKIAEFTQGMINNPVREKLNLGLASKAKYDKIKEDLITKGDYATENDRIFAEKFEEYLKQTGEDKKFAIDFIGGHELIEKNAPSRTELEKFVDNIHSSGYTYDNERGTWIDRESKKGVSFDHINSVLNLNANPFFKTNAGKQMLRRAKDYGMSPVQIFQEEITPIAAERAWSETSNTFRDNTARIKRLRDMAKEDEDKITPWQPAVTEAESYESGAHMQQKLNELRQSKDPNKVAQARVLEANFERLTNKAVKNLPAGHAAVVAASYNKIDKTDPDLLTEIYLQGKLPNERTLLRNILSKAPNKESKLKIITERIENAGFSEAQLDKYTKDALAKKIGLSGGYADIQKELDKTFQQGTGTETIDLLLNIKDEKVKTALRSNLGSLLTNDTFEISNITDLSTGKTPSESDVEDFSQLDFISTKINPASIKVRKGVQGNKPAIVFKTMAGGDYTSKQLVVTPKVWTPALESFLNGAVGASETAALKKEYNGAAYAPIGSNILYSQTEDAGLDPQKVGSISFVPSTKDKINIKQMPTDGGQPYRITNGEVYQTILEKSGSPVHTKALMRQYGISPDALIEKDGNITINPKYADKPAEFLDHMVARDFLAFKQLQ